MRLSKLFMIIVLCCILSVTSSALAVPDAKKQEGINWFSYEKGLAAGKKEGKKIFIHFWANWCGYCTLMEKKTFQDPKIIAYLNKNFIPIKVNTDKEKSIALKFSVRGLPTNWFLAENGEKIGNRPGFVPPKDLISFLEFIRTDSYKKMTFEAFSKTQKK